MSEESPVVETEKPKCYCKIENLTIGIKDQYGFCHCKECGKEHQLLEVLLYTYGEMAKIHSEDIKKIPFRPDTYESSYAIFVWMRQVNERLNMLESSREQKVVAERAEFETQVESIRDGLLAKLEIMEQRIDELERLLINKNQIENTENPSETEKTNVE